MKKVLFISNYRPSVGGISGQVEILQNKLSTNGIQADIFNTRGSALSRLFMPVKLTTMGNKYDVFHIHACSRKGFLPAVIGVISGKILRKRIVLTYHGGDADSFFEKHPRLVKSILGRTDYNIVLSGFLENVFAKYKIQCIVIPNILDLNHDIFRLRENVSPKFISVRSHSEIYNIDCILDAYSIVSKQYPDSSLTLLGDGPLHTQLQERANTMGLRNVHFVGRVSNAEIYTYLDHSDIMLSSPNVDNMPVSLLEGFNAGLLVIASNVGGVPYMINDGVNGLLFERGNSKDLADKMLSAISNYTAYKQMVTSAFESLSAYSWENVWNKLKVVYGL